MKNYGRVQSTVRPENIKIDEKSVWIYTDITETEEDYEYNMYQFGKDEYIKLMASRISDVETLILHLGGVL